MNLMKFTKKKLIEEMARTERVQDIEIEKQAAYIKEIKEELNVSRDHLATHKKTIEELDAKIGVIQIPYHTGIPINEQLIYMLTHLLLSYEKIVPEFTKPNIFNPESEKGWRSQLPKPHLTTSELNIIDSLEIMKSTYKKRGA